uniref:MARVEL domain-containing protein n=1 Tax=Panagrolaimus sp. PS1159 TaxID=55785 RepID=A0AC35EZW8_9BILA
MKVINIIKIACILMFVLIACLTLGSIIAYWRNVLNQAAEVDVDGKKIILKGYIVPLAAEDSVISKIGIINNCDGGDDKCTMPENTGFIGDSVIVAFLALTIVVYIICIIIMLASIFLPSFPPRALYFLPLVCFVGSVFLLAAAAIFIIYYNTFYLPLKGLASLAPQDSLKGLPTSDSVNGLSTMDQIKDLFIPRDGDAIYKEAEALGAGSLYKQDDGNLIGPHINKITYGAGFYLVVVTTVFSVLSICASGFAAHKSVKDEVVIEEKQEVKEVKVVKVQTVPAEPQSSEKNDSQKSS